MIAFWNAAVRRGLPLLALAIGAIAPAEATLLPQSWNGYHWAHTGNLAIMVGNNASAKWAPYLANAETTWSADKYIDYLPTAGMTNATTCGGVYGTIQVCSGNYGATGWSGWRSARRPGRPGSAPPGVGRRSPGRADRTPRTGPG